MVFIFACELLECFEFLRCVHFRSKISQDAESEIFVVSKPSACAGFMISKHAKSILVYAVSKTFESPMFKTFMSYVVVDSLHPPLE